MVKRRRQRLVVVVVLVAVAVAVAVACYGSDATTSRTDASFSVASVTAFTMETTDSTRTASTARRHPSVSSQRNIQRRIASSVTTLSLQALPTTTTSFPTEYSCHNSMIMSDSSTKSSSMTPSSISTSRTDRMVIPALPLSMEDIEALSSSSSSVRFQHSLSQSSSITSQSIESWMSDTVVPIVSCALLITANTVGAGCLVMPQLALSSGLFVTTILYVMAYIANVISGCLLADVAITVREQQQQFMNDGNAAVNTQPPPPPTSLNDFATLTFHSSLAGSIVAMISLGINSCVMAFDIDRFSSVFGGLFLTNSISSNNEPHHMMISILVATMIGTALTTLSSTQLSMACTICVTALFLSFGSLLLPGLATVPDLGAVFQVPGTSLDMMDSIAATFPIVLMSMVFQNIVPVVVKQLQYDRTKSMTAIALGAMIPLIMYVAWCTTCLGGGISMDNSSSSPLIATFSIATLTGSSLCTGMSLAEEFNTIAGPVPPPITTTLVSSNSPLSDATGINPNTSVPQDVNDSSFSLQTVVPSVAIPLIAALVFGGGCDTTDSSCVGLTGALAIAGSFGSPLLYGFLPALMVWRQRQALSSPPRQQQQSQEPPSFMIPSSALPALGFLSTIFVGQEMLSRFNDFIAFAT